MVVVVGRTCGRPAVGGFIGFAMPVLNIFVVENDRFANKAPFENGSRQQPVRQNVLNDHGTFSWLWALV